MKVANGRKCECSFHKVTGVGCRHELKEMLLYNREGLLSAIDKKWKIQTNQVLDILKKESSLTGKGKSTRTNRIK